MKYAENTTVPVDKSRAEIEKTLQRYGADQFLYAWGNEQAMIGFRFNGRNYKLLIPLPDRKDFAQTPTGRGRKMEDAMKAWEQACRQRWRALALWVKAVLEITETGVISAEEAFMAWTALPNGQTVGQFIEPQIEAAYKTGHMPPLLPWS